ncbi:carboxypeptidase O-like [Pseudophryne corroboree]|uniref:carboxypeptidase O-like n=1 Tax=Pseudophryne corroboree TaxID=495146 RepID=UPI0030815D72
MKEKLGQQNIPYKVMIEDVQKLIDSRPVSDNKARAISLDTYTYTEYHPMDEIYTWMELIKDKHSNLVAQHLLGHTYEERPIYYFKIGFPAARTKKVIFMDCGIHAREWIAPAYCQWFVKEILARQNEPLINKLLKQVDFYVVPVVNVDGYIYSFTTDRLWRKNRSPHDNGTCFGVDLNRNFDSHWGTIGTSPDCESILFCGPRPASEFETQGVVRLLEPMKSNTLMYLTIHSYGQYILLPYGHTYLPSVNHYEMTKAAEKAADELKKKYNTEYHVGSTAAILYYTSGSSADWASDLDILLSYTYELRDEGSFAFELPADQIEPTCEETWDSMVSLFQHIDEKHLGPLEDDDDNDGAAALSTHWIHMIISFSVCMYYALIR